MRRHCFAVKDYLVVAILLAVVAAISGCGGGPYTNTSASSNALGDTPPPVRTTNHWATSFEASEGFSLGNISGQNGWHVDWNPRPEACSATISDDMAATGSYSLKLDYPSSQTDIWWENCFALWSPDGIVPKVNLNSVILRMKIYRDPGQTEYPLGSGQMHPNIWFNQLGYSPEPRYLDFGDADQDMKLHASLQNSTPRTWDDPGWDQITGRFVEVIIYDNFALSTRIVWYDGRKVATIPILNSRGIYDSFSLGYQAVNPGVPAQLGKPMYIDDISVDWEIGPSL